MLKFDDSSARTRNTNRRLFEDAVLTIEKTSREGRTKVKLRDLVELPNEERVVPPPDRERNGRDLDVELKKDLLLKRSSIEIEPFREKRIERGREGRMPR
jgi:hypothetical protein